MRRFGAMVYDAVVLFGVLVLATIPFIPFLQGKVLIPAEVGWLAYAYWSWQILVCVVFFAYFWTRPKGQTLGMQAWRLRLETERGEIIRWPTALARIAIVWSLTVPAIAGYWLVWRNWSGFAFASACTVSVAPILACYAAVWIGRDRLAWHDRWTHTRVIVLPKS
jgi:uncharacterized RDD family membrane protein YckC